MGFGIIQAQGEAFDVAARPVDLERVELGAAIPNIVASPSALELYPSVRTCEGMKAPP
jgi:hypothetical protein